MKLIKHKQYKVSWFDISTDNNWKTKEEIDDWAKEPMSISSTWYYVGEFKNKNSAFYLFSSGISSEEPIQYFDIVSIPKGCVYKITKLSTKTP